MAEGSSPSGSLTHRVRSTSTVFSPAATSISVGVSVGGRFAPGSTVIGRVRVATRPSESFRSVPSVTSKVTELGPE